MKLGELWSQIEKFNDIYFPGWRYEDLRLMSNAMAGELGELCDATKHHYGGGTNPALVSNVSVDEMLEEAFDVFVYLVLFVGAAGRGMASFQAAGEEKLEVLYQRMKGKERGK